MNQMIKKQEGLDEVVNRYEIRIIKKNGDILWVDNYSTTIAFEGQPADLAILIDITHQKELMNSYTESEEKYRTIFEASPLGIGISNFEGNIMAANKKLQNLLGYTEEELQNLNARSTYADIHERQKILNILKKSGKVNNYEVKLKKKDGTVFLSSLNIEALEMGKNKVFLTNIEDITERKEAEKQIRYQAMLVENVHDAIISTDIDFNIISWNKVAEDIYGWKESEIKGKKVPELIPIQYLNDEEETVIKEFFNNGNWRGNVIQYHRDGSPLYIDSSVSLIKDLNGNQIGAVAINRDISEHKEYEKLVEDLAKFPSENPNPVLRVDNEKILYSNEAGKKLFNLSEGSSIPNMLHGSVILSIGKNIRNSIEVEINKRIYSFSITPIQEEGYTNIYGRDITEQKVSEEALKTIKEFTDNVLDTSIDTIFVFEPETGRAIRWNEAFREVSGYTNDEIASMKAPDSYYSEEDLIKAAEAIEKALNTGVTTVEMSLITKDGLTIPFEYTGKIFKSLDGDLLIVAVGRDITERKIAEQELKESEKKYRDAYNHANFYKELIAHDVNNILQSIHSSVELYKLSKEKPEMFKEKKDFLSSITENVFRGSKIASNVIKLSELEETKIPLDLVDINTNLMDAIVFTHKIYQSRHLDINVEGLEEVHYVMANDLILDLFQNALMNAVKHNINSVIEIKTRISEIQLENIKYCKIEFIDNGVGIPDDKKELIFQRRLINERTTRGMGIGLSLVKQIVDSYNGKIWVEDKVKGDYSKGSNFVILIQKAE
jgi:PAS domain S-box-containing protein